MLRKHIIPLIIMITLLVAWQYTLPRYPANSDEPIHKTFNDLRQKVSNEPQQELYQRTNTAPPHNPNEEAFRNARAGARRSALRALDQAWGDFCQPDGREKLVDALYYYFGQRTQQEKSYPTRWGTLGREYITAEWSTSDDQRIERLVQEAYGRGYINLRDFHPYVAERIIQMVKDTRVTAQPCTP